MTYRIFPPQITIVDLKWPGIMPCVVYARFNNKGYIGFLWFCQSGRLFV